MNYSLLVLFEKAFIISRFCITYPQVGIAIALRDGLQGFVAIGDLTQRTELEAVPEVSVDDPQQAQPIEIQPVFLVRGLDLVDDQIALEGQVLSIRFGYCVGQDRRRQAKVDDFFFHE